MTERLQDLPSTISFDVSRISFLLALFTCMTSQSSLSRRTTPSAPQAPSQPPSSQPPPQPSDCPQQCNDHGECMRGDNDVVFCQCRHGWAGNACGQACDKSCFYGDCQIVGNVPVCICPLGFHGERCQHKNYDASSFIHMAKMLSQFLWSKALPLVQDPTQKLEKIIQNNSSDCSSTFRCQNGGKCKHGQMGGYRCQCTSSKYTGDFCQFVCPHPCLNGGKCIRYRQKKTSSSTTISTDLLPITDGSNLQLACACPKDFYGRFCQRRRSRDSTTYLK